MNLYVNQTGMTDWKWRGIVADSILTKIEETDLKNTIKPEEQNETPPIERTSSIPLPQENEEKSFEKNLSSTEIHHKELSRKQILNTESYCKIKLKDSLNKALDNLKKFQKSLKMPEAPMYIHSVKKELNDSWDFITQKDAIISLILPAIEGALRKTKWQNYSHHQISIIQNILEECINEKIHNRKDAFRKISRLYKEDIDIFPSAPEEAYGDE